MWIACLMASRAPVARLSPAKQQKDMINGPSIIQPFMHQAFLSCIVLPCLPYLAACLSESPVSPVSPVYLSIHISYTYPSIHPSIHACQRSHPSSYNHSISHPILSYVLVCSDVPGFICGCDIQNYYLRWLSTATKVKLFQSTKLSICLSEASCIYGTGDRGLRTEDRVESQNMIPYDRHMTVEWYHPTAERITDKVWLSEIHNIHERWQLILEQGGKRNGHCARKESGSARVPVMPVMQSTLSATVSNSQFSPGP